MCSSDLSGSCRGGVGKRRRPCPVSRHASINVAGYWGPRRSALDPWLCREAKYERALGPGATIGILGTGVPRVACLWPAAWLSQQAVRPIFINKASKTLARGRASRGAEPREADDARPPQESPSQAGSRGAEISRLRGEAQTPTSNQSPCVDQGRRLLGPAALRTCPLASPRSQV